MAEYIERDKLISWLDVGHLRHPSELCYSEIDVANILLHFKTEDVVPVVRCRDCKYSMQNDGWFRDGVRYCSKTYDDDGRFHFVWDTDYCSDGEKMDLEVKNETD